MAIIIPKKSVKENINAQYPQGVDVSPSPYWLDRGLVVLRLFNKYWYQINLVTGNTDFTVHHGGVTNLTDRSITLPNTYNTYASVAHGLGSTFPGTFSLAMKYSLTSNFMAWSILKLSLPTWTGLYGDDLSIPYNSDFSNGLGFGGNTLGFAVACENSNSYYGYNGFGTYGEDLSFTSPFPINNSRIYLAAAVRSVVDNYTTVTYEYLAVFSKTLQKSELRSIVINPWQLFKSSKRILYFLPGTSEFSISGLVNASANLTNDYSPLYPIYKLKFLKANGSRDDLQCPNNNLKFVKSDGNSDNLNFFWA